MVCDKETPGLQWDEPGQSQDLDYVYRVFSLILEYLIDAFCDLTPQTLDFPLGFLLF